jgi:hypothetical protein
MSDPENAVENDNPFGKAQTVDPEIRAYVYSLITAVHSLQTPSRSAC